MGTTVHEEKIDRLLVEALDLRQRALNEIGHMWTVVRAQSTTIDLLLERRREDSHV